MNAQLSRLVKESAAYGLVPASSALASLVLVPVTTREFRPAEYGALGLLFALTTLLSVVVVLSLDSAAQRQFHLDLTEASRRTTFASWLWCQLGLAVVLCGGLALAAGPLAAALFGTAGRADLLRVGLAAVPLGALGTVATNWLRFQRRPWAAVTFALVTAAVTLGSTLVYLEVAGWGLVSLPLGQVTGGAAGTLLTVAMLGRWLDPRQVDLGRLRVMLGFGLPLVPATMAVWVVNLLDRSVLQGFDGARQVGLYQAANQLSAVVGIGATAFQLAWGPFAFSHASEPGARRAYARVMIGFTVAGATACAVVGSLAPELLSAATTSAYVAAAPAVPWLAFSFVAVGLMYVAAIGPSLVGRTGLIAWATLAGAAVTVVLDVLLIPAYGSTGAGIATFLAWSTVPVLLFHRAHRHYPVPHAFRAAAVLVVVDLAASVTTQRISEHGAAGVLLKLAVLTLVCGPAGWWALRRPAAELPAGSADATATVTAVTGISVAGR